MMQFKINKRLIELCLTYRCNIKCNNCSNLCTQAPFKGDLTPDNVKYFLNDIKNADICQITLHGGEPVLNPYIDEIMKLLVDFRKEHGTILWLLTNNSCLEIREKITRISVKYDVSLGMATKTNGMQLPYVPVNESSIDLGLPHNNGCFQLENCGICYNYLGWFPCSPMAAAARVFNYNPLGQTIKDFLYNELIDIMINDHCKHCGFSLPDRRRVTEQTSTKIWQSVFEQYNKERKV